MKVLKMVGMLSVESAAKALKVSRKRVYELVAQGFLESLNITDDDDRIISCAITSDSCRKYKTGQSKGPVKLQRLMSNVHH